jgi:hypothetical protein
VEVEAALIGHWENFPLAVGDAKIHRNWSGSRKRWRKFPLKAQKNTQNALTGPAHRPGEKGEKKQKKNTGGKLQNKKQEQEVIPLFFLTLLCMLASTCATFLVQSNDQVL